jgi:hypothetical protein
MANIKIAVLNSATAVPALEVQAWVRAIEIQCNRDYLPTLEPKALQSSVTISYVGPGVPAPIDAWWIAVVDDADMAGALGYHDLTVAGLPIGKVFVKTSKLYGAEPSVVLSHEVLEMLGDPHVNLTVSDGEDIRRYWAKEVCDAVQDDTSGYVITVPATLTRAAKNVRVSDFVLPSYWNSQVTKRPYSFKDRLTGPVPALAPGGYMPFVMDGVWDQISRLKPQSTTKERASMRITAAIDARRQLRLLPPKTRIMSIAKVVGRIPLDPPRSTRGPIIRPIPTQRG